MTPATPAPPLCPTCGVATVSAGRGLRACASGCRRVLPVEACAAPAHPVEIVVELHAPPARAEVIVLAVAPCIHCHGETLLTDAGLRFCAPCNRAFTAPPDPAEEPIETTELRSNLAAALLSNDVLTSRCIELEGRERRRAEEAIELVMGRAEKTCAPIARRRDARAEAERAPRSETARLLTRALTMANEERWGTVFELASKAAFEALGKLQ